MELKPVVKWAGGKRQLLDKLKEYMPKNYNKYFEPFAGGGALFFSLKPSCAVINDVNEDLIAVYLCLSDEQKYIKLLESLNNHEQNHNENYFCKIREKDRHFDYHKTSLWERASRLIYLNKSCFNGLYRVNRHGHFNVPSAKKNKVNLYDANNLQNIHGYFINNRITILKGDFAEAVTSAAKDDFVYFDPPYDAIDAKSSFTAYSKNSFTKNDQIRLAQTFRELTNKGVKVMASNHNTPLVNELYKDFNIYIVKAKRLINSKAIERGEVEEVIITNY